MADDGLRDRLAKQGEDALGKLAQELLENPLVNGAISRAFEAREKASQAQEAAMGALNIPSAADVERLTRRLRSVSQRLEGIEDGVDRLEQRLAELKAADGNPLAAVEERWWRAPPTRRRRRCRGSRSASRSTSRTSRRRRSASRAPRSPLRRSVVSRKFVCSADCPRISESRH
jgi:CRP-like cAMP-binding protein